MDLETSWSEKKPNHGVCTLPSERRKVLGKSSPNMISLVRIFFKTKNRIILTKQSGRVPKNLTASRILQISIALCQIKAKIHSFPTMYIIGGGKFGLTRWKKCLKPKRSPKNSCFGGNESQLQNFGGVWDPNFLRWPQFGGYPRKATCLSFKMSYVQGPWRQNCPSGGLRHELRGAAMKIHKILPFFVFCPFLEILMLHHISGGVPCESWRPGDSENVVLFEV